MDLFIKLFFLIAIICGFIAAWRAYNGKDYKGYAIVAGIAFVLYLIIGAFKHHD